MEEISDETLRQWVGEHGLRTRALLLEAVHRYIAPDRLQSLLQSNLENERTVRARKEAAACFVWLEKVRYERNDDQTEIAMFMSKQTTKQGMVQIQTIQDDVPEWVDPRRLSKSTL